MQLYKPSETAEVVVSSYSREAQAWSPLAASIIQHTFPYTGQPVSLMEDCCKVDIKLIFSVWIAILYFLTHCLSA